MKAKMMLIKTEKGASRTLLLSHRIGNKIEEIKIQETDFLTIGGRKKELTPTAFF